MNFAHVDAIVKAVLYEGYILYPYRPSSVKNRQRWTFGGVFPRGYEAIDPSSASSMRTEVLVVGDGATSLEVHVRFLHIVDRRVGALAVPVDAIPDGEEPVFTNVPSLAFDGRSFHAWEEVVERDVTLRARPLKDLSGDGISVPFSFSGARVLEWLRGKDGRIAGALERVSATVAGEVAVSAEKVATRAYRLAVRIDNLTPLPAMNDERSAAQARALVSTHTILAVEGGAFVSLLDPPDALRQAAAACDNKGTWPVLAGEEGATDTILSSPIILYDYPEIAPESPGDLFDGTEIDEILTLRILAMTDAEKAEMIATDEHARALLERTEMLTPADMARLHGTMRNPHFGVAKPELAVLNRGGGDLTVGARVRLRPKPGGDIMDVVLKDEIAVIEAIERDFEDRVHVAVVLEADPGREFGLERMPGHRFFFAPDEVEPIEREVAA